jgi:hypothetical protein
MKGWKTWVAAAGSILWGIGGFVNGTHDFDTASAFVISGFGLVGLGHKLDKAADPEAPKA